MTNKVENSILSIQQWKARAGLVSGAIGKGWEVKAEDRAKLDRPVTLYLCEPLLSSYAAFGVFDRTGVETLVETGIAKYGTSDEIFTAVTYVTRTLIASPAHASSELLDAALTGSLILYCSGETAPQIVADQSCIQFGMIVYAHPLVNDVAFRPMDLRNQVQVSDEIRAGCPNANFEKDRLVLTLKNYMLHDEPLLPDYFEGASVWDALFTFADRVRVDLPIHLEF